LTTGPHISTAGACRTAKAARRPGLDRSTACAKIAAGSTFTSTRWRERGCINLMWRNREFWIQKLISGEFDGVKLKGNKKMFFQFTGFFVNFSIDGTKILH